MGFLKHTSCPKCGSSDANAIYSDGGSHCYSCKFTVPSEDYRKDKKDRHERKKPVDTTPKKLKDPITESQKEDVKESTCFTTQEYRKIRAETYKYFGVRHSVNESTGDLHTQYYPVTQESELVGYKLRELPKSFGGNIGRTGAECDLFMQFRFTKPGRYVVITEGEIDALSAWQMLNDYNKTKGWDYETAVVSPTTGAMSAKQVQGQYKFFDQFEKIVLCYDNDKAGKEGAEELVKVLPKGKVYVMNLRMKDANEYLKSGNEQAFLKDFWDMQKYVPVGVVGSNNISTAMREELAVEKIPLPPFMHRLQTMMSGGIPLGRIVNLGSASGTGKSTITDEIIYYMLFNSPHMVGIVTLESTVGQYGVKLLSRHITKKIERLPKEDAVALLDSEEVLAKEKELFNLEDGSSRFYLVDDRDADSTTLKDAIENIIISCGCKVIVLDPISDVIAALPLDEQDDFMRWQKGMVKSHNVTFINVCHTRKTQSGQKAGSTGADLHEEDIIGSSSLYKSAACNLMFTRNKESENDIERNTTVMKATKIRWTGETGIAGKYYYDNAQHKLYDLEDWLEQNNMTTEF